MLSILTSVSIKIEHYLRLLCNLTKFLSVCVRLSLNMNLVPEVP